MLSLDEQIPFACLRKRQLESAGRLVNPKVLNQKALKRLANLD